MKADYTYDYKKAFLGCGGQFLEGSRRCWASFLFLRESNLKQNKDNVCL
jgi:hypothetical protein